MSQAGQGSARARTAPERDRATNRRPGTAPGGRPGRRRVRFLAASSVAVLSTAVAIGAAPVASAARAAVPAPVRAPQPTGARAYVVQGLAGEVLDVSVDGRTVLTGAATSTVVGPLTLSAGRHVVALNRAGATVVSARFTLAAGDDVDLVAHRLANAARTSVIRLFRNDVAAVPAGRARLVVSHVAVAPPADIQLDGRPRFRNVANGESLKVVVPAGQHAVSLTRTLLGGAQILAPVDVRCAAGTLTRVFAIGSAAQGSVAAVVQVLPAGVRHSARPAAVHTGDGGQAAALFADPSAGATATLAWIVVALVALGLVSCGAGTLRRPAGRRG